MNESMFEDNRKRTEKLLEKLVKILDAELKARLNHNFYENAFKY